MKEVYVAFTHDSDGTTTWYVFDKAAWDSLGDEPDFQDLERAPNLIEVGDLVDLFSAVRENQWEVVGWTSLWCY